MAAAIRGHAMYLELRHVSGGGQVMRASLDDYDDGGDI
jgi:hypothetical protein